MLEIIFGLVLLVIAFFYIRNLAFVKHHRLNRAERETLAKKYNRILRSRKELMGHFDWALARRDPLPSIEQLGREIERMDQELRGLQ